MIRIHDRIWLDDEEQYRLTRWFGSVFGIRTIEDLQRYFAHHRERIRTLEADYFDRIEGFREAVLDSLDACERDLLTKNCIPAFREQRTKKCVGSA